MSVRIAFDNPPEFYTNLDIISGRVMLGINRPENIGAVIVKLEGESKTALSAPDYPGLNPKSPGLQKSQVVHENHKVLYKVQQVYPDESVPAYSPSILLNPGQHVWNFKFKVPFNNACGDPNAMAQIGGLAGAGGFAGPSFFGMGGIRLMDGSKQLFYKHVTKTLPPSFTGFPGQAEIRYYVKVTIQRPGLFKENLRHQIGFKFLPIEPPRPPVTNQEAYARRPFTFRPKSPGLGGPSTPPLNPKRSSMFGRKASARSLDVNGASDADQPPSVELSARLPHPAVLTCNKPVPLRLIAKKLADSRAECYLTSMQMELVGATTVRAQGLVNTEVTKWVVVSRHGLAVPLQWGPDDAVGREMEVNEVLWNSKPLPNTVMPTFVTCNLKRTYALELRLGVSWGKPPGTTSKGKNHAVPDLTQTLFLPLHFSGVQVYSGLTPPAGLAQAAMTSRRQQTRTSSHAGPSSRPSPRPNAAASSVSSPSLPPRQQQNDPLYPPQLQPGQGVAPPSYDEAPPSYDEAMADALAPVSVEGRPAWSGVTNENAPDTLASKN
ncbi:hypothetical protein M406DRAFT_296007 [Cryphonectria parasitica EP155]|uniref:Arrestin-like N-terminal domain-containing protein n=1 Tax=Cryphonectria parasitica (strain ATCC 38755 / EP155) TaxID=660469 RepID=A0A9P4XTN0_CRYP1|nr:uncharacterized protein M406DRAFT_296007 [Cryphonectria parasitica EP155]KAF3760631.1 hypothetical protein M406DRAFT_296007 [Cryphonectria parasitica EP155]